MSSSDTMNLVKNDAFLWDGTLLIMALSFSRLSLPPVSALAVSTHVFRDAVFFHLRKRLIYGHCPFHFSSVSTCSWPGVKTLTRCNTFLYCYYYYYYFTIERTINTIFIEAATYSQQSRWSHTSVWLVDGSPFGSLLHVQLIWHFLVMTKVYLVSWRISRGRVEWG